MRCWIVTGDSSVNLLFNVDRYSSLGTQFLVFKHHSQRTRLTGDMANCRPDQGKYR